MFGFKKKKKGDDLDKLKERFKNLNPGDPIADSPAQPEQTIPSAEPMQAAPQPAETTPAPETPKPAATVTPEPAEPIPAATVTPEPAEPTPAATVTPEPAEPTPAATVTPEPAATVTPESAAPEQAVQDTPAENGTNVTIVDVTKLDNNQPEEVAPIKPEKPKDEKKDKPPQELEDPKLKEIAENVEESFEEARMNNIIMQQLKELIEIDNSLNGKIKDVEKKISKEIEDKDRIRSGIKMIETKLQVIEKSMDQFMTLYEVVTNQFNPFIQKEVAVQALPEPTAKIEKVPDVEDVPAEPPEDAAHYSIKDPVDGNTYEYAYDKEKHQAFLKKGDGWEESLLKEEFLEKHKFKEAAAPIEEKPVETIEEKPKEEAKEPEDQPDEANAELEKEKLKNKVFESHKAVLNNTIDGLKNELADHKTAVEAHKEENKILKSELDDHKNELEKHKKAIDEHKQDVNSKKKELESKANEAEKCKDEKKQMQEHIEGLKTEITELKDKKDPVDPEQAFMLKDGQKISSLNDLVTVLTDMDEDTFNHHINPERNDFAIWVNDVLKNEDLAIQLIAITDKKEMVKAIMEHLT